MKIDFSFFKFKITLFQKLLIGIVAMLVLNVVIVYTAIVSTDEIENKSEIILKESRKYKNLQELKLSFTELLMPANDYLIHGNKVELTNFKKLDSITKQRLESCLKLESSHFNKHFLEEIGSLLKRVNELSYKIFNLKNPVGNIQGALIMEVMDSNIVTVGKKLDILLKSSSLLTIKYINLNKEKRKTSSTIIIFTVLIITISLVVGGFYYAREITEPIESLSSTVKNVVLGNLDAKAEISTRTHDEIDNFAILFNNMIGVLSEKTVSRDYLSSIIQKINKSLIITNTEGKILIVNNAALELLEYNEGELIGESIEKILLGENKDIRATVKEESVQNIYNTYYSKSNVAIPVSFSKSFIYDNKNKKTGIMYLAFNKTLDSNKKFNLTDNTINIKSEIKIKDKSPLTTRELEIIKLILADYSNQEIADKLFISIRTVETHRKNIMEKLHVKSVIGLVHYAIQNGLI